MEQLEKAINKMKTEKPPLHDLLTVEVIRYMGHTRKKVLSELMNKIPKENKVSADWELAVILPLLGKADAKEWENDKETFL